MLPCSSCCFPNSEQSRLCGHCGIYLKPIGDYILTERIGAGGFAEVYRANNRYTGHAAAIKLLHEKLINDREIEQRFLREGEILRDLRSPNVVHIYDFGVLPDLGLYLVMEWLDGESLDVYVHHRDQKRLPFTEVVPLFTQLLYGLSRIHEKQVVHRDLKPKNFMVVHEQGKPVLKILDFGIAWVPGGQDLTERGMFVGSTYFMAPEQFKAQKGLFGPSTDLYVAGQLLLWMLTGKHVFTANTLQALAVRHCCEAPPTLTQMRPDLLFCPELEALVARSLEKKPAGRFGSALDFLDAFKAVIPLQLRYMDQSSPHAGGYRPSLDGYGHPVVQGEYEQAGAGQSMQPMQSMTSPQESPLQSPMAQAPPQGFGGSPQAGGGGAGGGGGGAGGWAGDGHGAPHGGAVVLERGDAHSRTTRRMNGQSPDGFNGTNQVRLQRHQATGLQTSDVPGLASLQQNGLQSPDPRYLLQVDAPLKHTPLHPLKALPKETANRDSSPGLPDSRPLHTFLRKTTSVQQVPGISSASRKGLLRQRRSRVWGVLLLGLGLLLAGLGLYFSSDTLIADDASASHAARVPVVTPFAPRRVPLVRRAAPRQNPVVVVSASSKKLAPATPRTAPRRRRTRRKRRRKR